MKLNSIQDKIQTIKEISNSVQTITETARTLESFFNMLHILKTKIANEASRYDSLVAMISDHPHYENELGRAEFAKELMDIFDSYKNEKIKQEK